MWREEEIVITFLAIGGDIGSQIIVFRGIFRDISSSSFSLSHPRLSAQPAEGTCRNNSKPQTHSP